MKASIRLMSDLSFRPVDQDTVDWMAKLKIGQVVAADFRATRNYEFHKKYFGMLKVAFENQDQFPSLDALRQAVQIAAGYYDIAYLLDGTTYFTSKSISFGKMKQDEFEKLYSDVLNVILAHFGFGEEFEIELIVQFG
tara:strand:+ start:2756 stop:3169 length:414 start_codon:yes stop_codon:yes gene_type:complete